jgi:HprK-related kinase B
MKRPTDTRSLLAEWLGDVPCEHTLDLRVHDCRIRVRASSGPTLMALGGYYHDFVGAADQPDIEVRVHDAAPPALELPWTVVSPGPGKTRVKDEYFDLADGRVLHKHQTGMVFVFGGDVALTVGPARANLNQVINFINNRFVQWMVERGFVLCHAAGVATGRDGLLLAGLSGRGKSTLALHLLERGLDFVSNDRLLLRREGDRVRMVGLPKMPRVNPGTLLNSARLRNLLEPAEQASLATLAPEALWSLEQKYDVDIATHYGPERFRLAADLVGAAVLTWTRDGDGGLKKAQHDPADAGRLLDAIAKPPGVHYWPGPGAEPDHSRDTYARLLRDKPLWELGGTVDFESAVSFCCEQLDAPGASAE